MAIEKNLRDSLRVTTLGQAQRLALEALALEYLAATDSNGGSGAFRISLSALSAASLRATLWALSDEGEQPVYVTRLLNSTVDLLAPFERLFAHVEPVSEVASDRKARRLPQAAEGYEDYRTRLIAALRSDLSDLETVGDIASLSHGRWLPSPLRTVRLPAADHSLLIGGLPTHRLPVEARSVVRHAGSARILLDDSIPSVLLPAESFTEWCRAPKEDIVSWTRQVLAQAELASYSGPPPRIEFYAPGVESEADSRSDMQYYRWSRDCRMLPDGQYLARERSDYLTHYEVCRLEAGQITALGVLNLREGDIRRLMYGLDAIAECPVSVQAETAEDDWVFVLRNELPAPEQRLFTALGRLHEPEDGSYYPRRWQLAREYAPQAAHALERLGVTLRGIGATKPKPR